MDGWKSRWWSTDKHGNVKTECWEGGVMDKKQATEREPVKYAIGGLQGTPEEKFAALGLINITVQSGVRARDLREILVESRSKASDRLIQIAGFDPDRLAKVVSDILDFLGDMQHECPDCCPELFNEDGTRKVNG